MGAKQRQKQQERSKVKWSRRTSKVARHLVEPTGDWIISITSIDGVHHRETTHSSAVLSWRWLSPQLLLCRLLNYSERLSIASCSLAAPFDDVTDRPPHSCKSKVGRVEFIAQVAAASWRPKRNNNLKQFQLIVNQQKGSSRDWRMISGLCFGVVQCRAKYRILLRRTKTYANVREKRKEGMKEEKKERKNELTQTEKRGERPIRFFSLIAKSRYSICYCR